MEIFGVALNFIMSNLMFIIPIVIFAGYLYWYIQRNRRRQKVLLIQEDRNIVEKSLPVETHYIGERKIDKPAWLMLHKLLFPFKNRLYAIVTERDSIPLDIFGEVGDDEIKKMGDIQNIAREHYRSDRERITAQNTNRMIVYILGMMVAVIAILMFIIIGAPYISEKFGGG